MSLLEYIIWSEREELENFKYDLMEILEFFQPQFEELGDRLSELNSKKPNCVWDNTECIYKTNIIVFNPQFTNIQDKLVQNLMNYLEKNSSKWEEHFSKKKWFESKHENAFILRTEKILCHLCVRILLRELSGEPIEDAINTELELLFQVRSPITLRKQQVILQNIALVDDMTLEFEEQTLSIEGQDLRWHEGKEAKSCKIENFELKFKIQLRRMTLYEFDYLTSRKGFFAQQMNISTYLEIIYEYPNENLPRNLSNAHWKSMLASSKVESFLNKIITNVTRALKLASGKQVYPVKLYPEYFNFYQKRIISRGFPLVKRNYLFYFFTDSTKLNPERFKSVSEIFDIILKAESNPKVEQILNIIDRADEALQHGLTLLALVMYWIMIETVLDGDYKYRAKQASWLYGIHSNKYLEEKFWITIYSIRNKYMHGEPFEKIGKLIEGFNKEMNKVVKDFVKKDIPSLTLTTREKAYRIFLFLLLLNKYSKGKTIINPDKRIMFQDPPFYDFKSQFNEWVQLGTEQELGEINKHKSQRAIRTLWI